MSGDVTTMADALISQELGQRLARDISAMTEAHESGTGPTSVREASGRHAVENTEFLKALVVAHGWPVLARFGLDGHAAAGWLLAFSGFIDPAFQSRCLELMYEALSGGDEEPEFVAFTTDRVLLSQAVPSATRHKSRIETVSP
ncbi:MAG TPA: hypothetical protein VGX23_18995 [Actinocrinis sp.]|nr:hypothetical protein [Actinocrinis sp.]